MRDFGSTVLVSTPSYALYLYEYMKNMCKENREKIYNNFCTKSP